ncbi:MAG: hypothetical protein ACOVQ2_03005 [Flavobacterium sp.]
MQHILKCFILIFHKFLDWKREGVAKVALSNLGYFLVGVGGDSTAHDLTKKAQITRTTLRRLTAFARALQGKCRHAPIFTN